MKRQHLVFVSYEIHPVTAGGCGVFLWHEINELLKTTDYEITLLLDIPKFECEEFIQKYTVNMVNRDNLNVVCLSDKIPSGCMPLESFQNIFLYKSYIFYKVLEQLEKERQIDYIEFFDYVGIGYFSINAKKYENKFNNTLLAIRGHCTVDLMDLEQRQNDFSKEKIEMYQMEKIALQNSDVVLVQTESWKELYSQRYGINIDKILVAEPPMDNSNFPKYKPNNNKNVLFYGRVFQLKGIDEYIKSAVQYLQSNSSNSETKFYVVGYDGKTVDGKSYSEFVKRLIPKELKTRFIFTGKLGRKEFSDILNDISIAVFPNYVESFCYSIHEIYEAGVPILCRRIPSFTGYFIDQKNCLMYDKGINQLVDKMSQLLDSHELREKLSYPYKTLQRISQKKKYEEILQHNNLVEENVEENEINKISVVYLNNYTEEFDFYSYIQNLNNKYIDYNTCFNIYMNPKFIPSKEMKQVDFLGREVYIQSYNDKNLFNLKEIVAIFNIQDEISSEFIIKSQNIINEKDIGYVMPVYTDKNNKLVYPKYALYKENSYRIFRKLENIVLNNKNKLLLNELFDFRCGLYGVLNYLQLDGYVIPYDFGNRDFSEFNIEESKEELIFSINNSSRDKLWNPFNVYELLENNSTLINKDKVLFKKDLYHRIKDRMYKSNSIFNRAGLILLEIMKKAYIKSHIVLYGKNK